MADCKFKAGDTLIAKDDHLCSGSPNTDYNKGDKRVVERVNEYGHMYLKDCGDYTYSDSYFELMEEATSTPQYTPITPQYTPITPKVGDKFRVVKEIDGKYLPEGFVLEVLEVQSDSNDIKVSDTEDHYWPLRSELTTEYLEPVEDEVTTGMEHMIRAQNVSGGCTITNNSANKIVNDAYNALCDNQEWHNNRLYTWTTNATSFGVSDCEEPSTLTNIKTKTMNLIRKAMLTADQKALIKAGYMTDNLGLTGDGQEALDFLVYQANEKALVEMAKEAVKEEEAKK